MTLERSKSIDADLQMRVRPVIPQEGAESEDQNISLRQKIKLIFTNITVEPIMICYVLPSVMASLAVQNLSLEKACRVNLKFPEATCDALTGRNTSAYNSTAEAAIHKAVATMTAWQNVIQSLLPAMLLMFLGSWSDRHNRRKPCIILPIVGEIMSCVGFLLSTYFFYQLPMEFNAMVEAVPPGVTGGWFCMFVGVYSYVSGISSVKTRTLRIGAVNMFANVGIVIGTALSGILYNKIGFYGVFGLALSLHLSGLLYGLLRVKETPKPTREHHENAAEIEKEQRRKNFCADFFDFKHVSDTFAVAFKKGERNRRKKICGIMVLMMLIVGPVYGELNVMYLFVRYKFGWNEVDYSMYSTFNFIAFMLGTLFSLIFFSKFLKLNDNVLGMISSTSKIASSFVYAFAPTSTIFYLGAILEMFNGTSFIAMRSITSKLVAPEELGKINSLFGVSEALMPLIYGPMYSLVYNKTLGTLPGSFLLLGGFLTTPAVLIFFWLYREQMKDAMKEEKEREYNEKLLIKQQSEQQEVAT